MFSIKLRATRLLVSYLLHYIGYIHFLKVLHSRHIHFSHQYWFIWWNVEDVSNMRYVKMLYYNFENYFQMKVLIGGLLLFPFIVLKKSVMDESGGNDYILWTKVSYSFLLFNFKVYFFHNLPENKTAYYTLNTIPCMQKSIKVESLLISFFIS